MCHTYFLQLLPFFSGFFFFLLSSLGGGLWTAAAAGEADGAGPEGVGGVGTGVHSALASAEGMATSSTTGGTQDRGKMKNNVRDQFKTSSDSLPNLNV